VSPTSPCSSSTDSTAASTRGGLRGVEGLDLPEQGERVGDADPAGLDAADQTGVSEQGQRGAEPLCAGVRTDVLQAGDLAGDELPRGSGRAASNSATSARCSATNASAAAQPASRTAAACARVAPDRRSAMART
jgi:hypothetical protein